MDLSQLLFSFNGRINRARYWLGVLMIAVTGALVIMAAVMANLPYLFLGLLPVTIVMLALAAKRLHDRDKSGWWVVPFIVIPGILDRVGNRLEEDSAIWWAVALAALLLSLWGLVEIGFRRGTPGDNMYGPDPLAAAPAGPAVPRPDGTA